MTRLHVNAYTTLTTSHESAYAHLCESVCSRVLHALCRIRNIFAYKQYVVNYLGVVVIVAKIPEAVVRRKR